MATKTKQSEPMLQEEQQEPSLTEKVVAARKAAEAAMPLGHDVQHSSEIRSALILIAQVQAIAGGDVPDFSEAPEYVAPPEPDDEDAADAAPSKSTEEE